MKRTQTKMGMALVAAVTNCVNEGRNPAKVGKHVITRAAQHGDYAGRKPPHIKDDFHYGNDHRAKAMKG